MAIAPSFSNTVSQLSRLFATLAFLPQIGFDQKTSEPKAVAQWEGKKLEVVDLFPHPAYAESNIHFWNKIPSLLQSLFQRNPPSKKEWEGSFLEKEVLLQGKAPLSKAQQKELAFVEKSLGKRLEALRSMSEEEFVRFTQRFPRTRAFLNPFRNSSSPLKEISGLVEQYEHFLASNSWLMDPAQTSSKTNLADSPLIKKSETALDQWLQTPLLPVNNRLLAHVLGDSFAKGSGLEGYSSKEMRKFIQDALVQRKSLAEDPTPYDEILSQFQKAERFDAALRSGPETLLQTFQNELSHLKKGEKCFLQAGWTSGTTGHAVVLEIRRQENNLFTFRIYNSGEGIEYHEKMVQNHQTHFSRFFELQDIHLERIANLSFCKSLCMMLQKTPPYGEWNGVELYESLALHLDGKQIEQDADSEHMSQQDSVGFCTYLSLAFWMQDFAPKLFDRWAIEFQTKVFSDFSQEADLHLESNLKLIQKSGERLEQHAKAAFEKGIITSKEWEAIQQVIGFARVEEPTIGFESSLESVPFRERVDALELKALSEKIFEGKELDLLSIEEMSFRPETFLSEAASLQRRFEKAIENQNYELVQAAVLEWIERIPFQKREELFAILKPEEAVSLLRTLSEIGKDYLYCTLMIQPEKEEYPVSPRTALAFIKLLSFGRALSFAFAESGGLRLPNLYQNSMNLLLEGWSGSNHLFSPTLEEDLLILRAYWNKEEPPETRKELSFFGFEYDAAANALPWRAREIFETKEEQDKYAESDPWLTIDWPDILWAEEYIQKPEIRQQILLLDPELGAKPSRLQAFLTMYGDKSQEKIEGKQIFLPQAFSDLFDLSFFVDFAIGAPTRQTKFLSGVYKSSIPPSRKLGIQINPSSIGHRLRNGEQYTTWSLRKTIFGLHCAPTADVMIELPQRHSQSSPTFHDRNFALQIAQDALPFDRESLFRIQEESEILEQKGWSQSYYRHRLSPAHRVLQFPNSGWSTRFNQVTKKLSFHPLALEMPLQPMREKLGLSADPDLQIRETVAYYQKNQQLLENREEQILFKKLFFEPPLLLEFFLNHPQEAAKFTSFFEEFCQKGVRSYTELGNPLTAAFYLELTDKFQRFLSYFSAKHPELLPSYTPKINASQQLKALIDRGIHAPEDEVHLYLDLLLMQSPETLDRKSALDLLEAAIRLQTVVWPEKTKKGPDRFYRSNRQSYGPDSTSYLNSDYPRAKEILAKEQLFTLRSSLERLLRGSKRDEILNALMERLDPSFQPTQWSSSPKFPFFQSDDGSVQIDVLHSRLYQKGGQIKMLPRTLRDHADLFPFLDRSKPLLGFEIEPNVFEFSSKNKEKMRVFLGSQNTIVLQKQIEGRWAQKIAPFPSLPKALQELPEHWLSLDLPKVLWIGNNSKASLKDSELCEVTRNDTGWILGDSKIPPSSPLLHIEDPNYILPWIDPINKKMKQIELPRLALVFDIDEKGFASSSYFEGYRIAKEQYIPTFGNLRNYLTLENGRKKIAVMPAYQRFVERGKGLETDASFNKETSMPLLVFDLDTDGLPLPKSDSARLYLAYLLLTEQRYQEAWDRLVGTDSELRPLNPIEKEILLWIGGKDKIVQDPDPRATALRLKAQLILMRDEEHFFSHEKREYSESHYADLPQKWDETPPRFLPSPKEEQRLWRFLSETMRPHIRSRMGRLGPFSIQRTKEEVADDQETIKLLTPEMTFELFQGRTMDQKEEKNKSYHVFLRASDWDFNFILQAYGCIKNPTKDSLRILHRHFFPEKEPMVEEEMIKEIRDSLALVARSRSKPAERAAAALLLGMMDSPSEFPSEDELRNHLFNEKMKRQYLWRDRDPIQIWAKTSLSKPIKQYVLPYAERSNLPPYQLFVSPEIETRGTLWTGQSTRLSSILAMPDVNLAPLFDIHSLSPYAKAHESLIDAFSFDAEMAEHLKVFAQSSKASPKRYAFKQAELLSSFENSVKTSSLIAKEREIELEIDLLKAVNRIDGRPIPQLKQIGGYLSDRQIPIRMSELLKFFLTVDTESLRAQNPALSLAECHKIYQKTQEFLIIATQRQHLERIYKKCSALRNGAEADRERLIEELALEGGQKRAYAPEKHPDYLLIEYGNNIRLRKTQVEAIEALTPGTAQEMIMGSGKTMVLLPLLALKAANGENLSMIVMPHELLPSMSEALDGTLGRAFSHSIDVFTFNRDTHLDARRLERIYERLQRAIEKRRVIAMSGSSLQSFFLMAIDSFYNKSPEAVLYRKILALMKKSGNLILDEMHLLLDVLQAHHFSAGEKKPLSSVEMDGATLLFQILSSIGWNGSKPISRTDYESKWKEKLVEIVLEGDAFAPFSKEALKNYLLEKPASQGALYVDRMQSRELQNTLATLKEQINRLLPLVLSKQIDEHFGEIPSGANHHGETKRVAIPYHGSQNPVLGSEFGSDLETIDYTTLLHLVKGVDTDIVKQELDSIKERILRELDELWTKDIRQAPSYKRFCELAGSDRYPLFMLKSEEIEEIRQKINQSAFFKLQLIRSWILPELRTYPRQLFTNGHSFPLLVDSIRGFSGTNWNSKTFPKAFDRQFASDTVSYTLHLLQSKEAPLVIPKEPKELLKKIADRSLADRGGIFRQMKNRQVAQSILSGSKAKGAVYYEGDTLKVLPSNQADPIPYANCPFAKEELIAFWDQKHTTGSDIPLGASAQAIVTIGRHTHLFELLQAVWRLRGLHQGQKVQFALLEEEADFIAAALNHPKDTPLETKDLFLYCWLKERQRGKDHAARALSYKMTNELIAPVLEQICDEKRPLPSPEILDELFYKEKGKDPYEQYGRIAHSIPKENSTSNQIERLLQSRAAKSLPLNRQAAVRKNVEAIAKVDLPNLPDQITSYSSSYENEVEIETQTESEKEQEKEVEKEIEQEIEKATFNNRSDYLSRGIISWEGSISRKDFLPSSPQILSNFILSRARIYKLDDFRSNNLAPIVSVPEALQLFDTSIPFDPALIASATFFPLQKEISQRSSVYPFFPFNQYQDIVQEVLLIEDLETGQIKMMLLNQDEAKQFEMRLSKERHLLENGVRLALYHLDYGLYAEGPGFPSELSLHQDPHFMRLKVQAKLFNGDVHYSQDEQRALEAWFAQLKNQGALSQVKNVFESKILEWKSKSKADFPRSFLYKLFQRYL